MVSIQFCVSTRSGTITGLTGYGECTWLGENTQIFVHEVEWHVKVFWVHKIGEGVVRERRDEAQRNNDGKQINGAGEMAQQLRALAAIPVDPGSIFNNHMAAHNHL